MCQRPSVNNLTKYFRFQDWKQFFRTIPDTRIKFYLDFGNLFKFRHNKACVIRAVPQISQNLFVSKKRTTFFGTYPNTKFQCSWDLGNLFKFHYTITYVIGQLSAIWPIIFICKTGNNVLGPTPVLNFNATATWKIYLNSITVKEVSLAICQISGVRVITRFTVMELEQISQVTLPLSASTRLKNLMATILNSDKFPGEWFFVCFRTLSIVTFTLLKKFMGHPWNYCRFFFRKL